MSSGVKIIVFSAVVIGAGMIVFYAIRNKKIRTQLAQAEADGFQCSHCQNGVMSCQKDDIVRTINCSYKLA